MREFWIPGNVVHVPAIAAGFRKYIKNGFVETLVSDENSLSFQE